MSAFLTRAIAEEAVKFFLEEMKTAMKLEGKNGFDVVVLDPAVSFLDDRVSEKLISLNLTHSILYELPINEENWGERTYEDTVQL